MASGVIVRAPGQEEWERKVLLLTDETFAKSSHPPPPFVSELKERTRTEEEQLFTPDQDTNTLEWERGGEGAAGKACAPPTIHLSVRLPSLLFWALHLQTWGSSKGQTRTSSPEASPTPLLPRSEQGFQLHRPLLVYLTNTDKSGV